MRHAALKRRVNAEIDRQAARLIALGESILRRPEWVSAVEPVAGH